MANRAVFIQSDIWRWLRKNPGSSSTQIASALKITKCSSSLALARMKKNESAYMTHRDGFRAARHAIWYAKGTKPPSNQSGAAKGSLDALRIGWNQWEAGLLAAAQATGRTYTRRKPKPPTPIIDGHPLSASWMIPMSGVTNEKKRD